MSQPPKKKRVFWDLGLTPAEESDFQGGLERLKSLQPQSNAVEPEPPLIKSAPVVPKPPTPKVTKPAKPEKTEWEKRVAKGVRQEAIRKRKAKRSQEIKARLLGYEGLKKIGVDDLKGR